jgi:radical SAM-linked protein
MIGLPTETQEDLEAIIDLVKRLKRIAGQKGKGGKINVSVATFVPKPHTPFQWEPQIRLDSAVQKLNWLRENLKLPGLQVKFQDPHISVIEGIWARGDRNLSKVLVSAWKRGCRFDGWSDFFNYERWLSVLEDCGMQANTYSDGFTDIERALPWDHIDIGVTRTFLLKEMERAKSGRHTGDCRTGDCSGCGVCDFESIKPVCFKDQIKIELDDISAKAADPLNSSIKYLINYNKTNSARFLGHLEMAKIFIRSLRRAKIPLKYSAGFHPMPKISFKDTLPMGMQSENEEMIVTLTEPMDPSDLMRQIQQQVPEGLVITACKAFDPSIAWTSESVQQYHIELKDGFFRQNDLDFFFEQPSITIERKSKKGKRISVDLKKAVSKIDLLDSRHLTLRLAKDGNHTVRPAQVLREIFQLTEEQILSAIITKKKANHA